MSASDQEPGADDLDSLDQIENPPEIMWGENRSLLLTLRHIQTILKSDPDLAFDLLSVAYLDARQIIEDADIVVREVRGQRAPQRKLMAALAESIEGELEADDAVDDDGDENDEIFGDADGDEDADFDDKTDVGHRPGNGTAKLTE